MQLAKKKQNNGEEESYRENGRGRTERKLQTSQNFQRDLSPSGLPIEGNMDLHTHVNSSPAAWRNWGREAETEVIGSIVDSKTN